MLTKARRRSASSGEGADEREKKPNTLFISPSAAFLVSCRKFTVVTNRFGALATPTTVAPSALLVPSLRITTSCRSSTPSTLTFYRGVEN